MDNCGYNPDFVVIGFIMLPAAGSLIHILLVIAVILVTVQLVSGKKL